MYTLYFPCTYCKKEHPKVLPNKTSAVLRITNGEKNIFCNLDCRKLWHEQQRRTATCLNCEKEFWQEHKTKKFCSRECYGDHMKNNPADYNLPTKAGHMHQTMDKQAAIAKMLITKQERGQMIEWNNAEWKQYWRRCNHLTRKIRPQMLENWDGFDYIDGEYIKDNLNLHFLDRNYPSLDHIKPRSQCFKEGLSPYEATSPENLAWTKRVNNSKKYNKKLGS
jgi:hypothetical protein